MLKCSYRYLIVARNEETAKKVANALDLQDAKCVGFGAMITGCRADRALVITPAQMSEREAAHYQDYVNIVVKTHLLNPLNLFVI